MSKRGQALRQQQAHKAMNHRIETKHTYSDEFLNAMKVGDEIDVGALLSAMDRDAQVRLRLVEKTEAEHVFQAKFFDIKIGEVAWARATRAWSYRG